MPIAYMNYSNYTFHVKERSGRGPWGSMDAASKITRRSLLVRAVEMALAVETARPARTALAARVAHAGEVALGVQGRGPTEACRAAPPSSRSTPGEDSMDRIDRLMALFRRRWACPVLAELHRAEGAKFVTLVHRLGSNPGAMRQTLDELLALGWIERNPGYGHPLRPEYLLTPRGERLGPICALLDQAATILDVRDVAFRKWSMPVLYVVGEGPTRFKEIPLALGAVTDRAVSLALKDLAEAEMISRTVIGGSPPGSVYGATPAGGRLLPILDRV